MLIRTPQEALNEARRLTGKGVYILGTGDWNTPDDGAYDCFGFALNKCYGVKRHRPGFNHGPWATVEDDLNCNSAIEDARHKKELFEEVPSLNDVQAGDLIAYPTFRLKDENGVWHQYIGHIGLVEWRPFGPLRGFRDLHIIQCHGPNNRRPGIVATDGMIWDNHDHVWPKQEHRTAILRPIQGREAGH